MKNRLAAGYPLGVARRLLMLVVIAAPHFACAQTLVGWLEVPGEEIDKYADASGANGNRLGAFGSDLVYDAEHEVFYGLVDRGPGGGKLHYVPRVEKFKLDCDLQTGKLSQFELLATYPLFEEDQPCDGKRPKHDRLERNWDPEGLAISSAGRWFISEEYAPTVAEFALQTEGPSPQLNLKRRFTSAKNCVPRDSYGNTHYTADASSNPPLAHGRVPNKGFEGLAISPDGKKLFAMLQAPLVDEGLKDDGERGRFIRIVEFDIERGEPARQFLYEIEPVEKINQRIPHEDAQFSEKKPGKATGISALVALNEHEFLVLERDNRGIGIDNPNDSDSKLKHVGSKRIYRIDIAGATDVAKLSLRGLDQLPPKVKAVRKTLSIDMAAELRRKKLPIPEKLEGLAIGPRLKDGRFLLFVATDNDLSVTQTESDEQQDVFTDGSHGPIDGDARGRKLLPTWIYAFAVKLPGYARR